jgi:hypothetical protein
MGFYDDYKFGTDGDSKASFWKRIAIAVIVVFVIFILILCFNSTSTTETVSVENNTNVEYPINKSLNFKKILGDLVFDPLTKIVYIDNYTSHAYSVYTPYYAPNGIPFRYNEEKGELEQIDPREWFEQEILTENFNE